MSTGTSMATPHVTGAIARVWSVCRTCSAAQVEQCLLSTASGNGSRTNDVGYGLVRTEDAYTCLVETVQCCAQEEVEVRDTGDTIDGTGNLIEDFPEPVPRPSDPEPVPTAPVPDEDVPEQVPRPTDPEPEPTPPVPTPPVPTPPVPSAPICRRRKENEPCRRDTHCCSQKCGPVKSFVMTCLA
jgi:hypothetical protein